MFTSTFDNCRENHILLLDAPLIVEGLLTKLTVDKICFKVYI